MESDVTATLQTREATTYAQTNNRLARYFGPPQGEVKVGAYDRLAVATNTLPDVYKGRNLFLRDTIDGFIFENNEWMTTLALPWLYTDEHNIAWNEWHFNGTLAGEVPPEGISRLITTSNSAREAHVVRRGLAFILEHGFWRTAAGDEQYRRNILGIKQCVQETQNYDVSVAIRYCRNYDREYRRKRNMLNVPVKALMAEEIDYFIVLQKGSTKLDYLITKMLKRMAYHKVTPDLMIAPKDFRMYYGKLDPVKTMYYSYGPDGVMALKEGPDAPTSIQGMTVVESRHLDIAENSPPVDVFLDDYVHGTHYFLRDPAYGEKHDNYRTSWLDSYIYNEDQQDDFVKVQFQEAFKYCQRFDETDGGRPSSEHEKLLDDDMLRRLVYSSSGAYAGVGAGVDQKLSEPLRDMFVHRDENGQLHVLTKLGNMELDYCSHDSWRRMAQTLAQHMSSDDDKRALAQLITLLEQSAKIVPTQAYLAALIQRNLSRSFVNGAFRGQLTAEDSAETYQGKERLAEMTENEFGGLDLPARPAGYQGPPPLIESWGMLQTLASEANRDNGWSEHGQIAAAGVAALKNYFAAIGAAVPTNIFGQPEVRSPWYKTSGAEQALFENHVSVPRDAVFLRIPAQGAGAPAAEMLPVAAKKKAAAAQGDATNSRTSGMYDLVLEMAGDREGDGEFSKALGRVEARYLAALPKDDAEKPGKQILLYQSLLAVALHGVDLKKPKAEDVDKARAVGRKNLRKVVFTLDALAPANDPKSPALVLQNVQALTALWTGATDARYPGKAVNVGAQALAQLLDRKEVVDPEEKLANSENPVTAIKAINAYNQARAENSTDFRELRQASDQIVVSAIEIDAVLRAAGASPAPIRKDLAKKDYKAVVASLEAANANNVATERIDRLKRLVDAYTAKAKDTIDLDEDEDDAAAAAAPSLNVNKAAYANGIWVRAPLPSLRAFAEDALMQETPLALPSDPSAAHLKPFTPEEASRESIEALLQREAYTNRGRSVHETTYARSLRDWAQMIKTARRMTPAAARGGAAMAVTRALRREQTSDAQTTIDVVGPAPPESKRGPFTHTFVKRWQEGSKIADPVVRMCYHALLGAQNVKSQWEALLENDVLPPCSLLLHRPFITRRVYSVPFMKGGYSTGACFWGHSDFLLGDDVVSKCASLLFFHALQFQSRFFEFLLLLLGSFLSRERGLGNGIAERDPHLRKLLGVLHERNQFAQQHHRRVALEEHVSARLAQVSDADMIANGRGKTLALLSRDGCPESSGYVQVDVAISGEKAGNIRVRDLGPVDLEVASTFLHGGKGFARRLDSFARIPGIAQRSVCLARLKDRTGRDQPQKLFRFLEDAQLGIQSAALRPSAACLERTTVATLNENQFGRVAVLVGLAHCNIRVWSLRCAPARLRQVDATIAIKEPGDILVQLLCRGHWKIPLPFPSLVL